MSDRKRTKAQGPAERAGGEGRLHRQIKLGKENGCLEYDIWKFCRRFDDLVIMNRDGRETFDGVSGSQEGQIAGEIECWA